ncbi:MmcQ/YjbR family DNA-binding protein [Streptosporangiaceae bacterium NEAU-GS5]|nr:MmcQ/YjbR family DNA-binding protein [Streptosporangiaceae bacterium NEAU-GS5]
MADWDDVRRAALALPGTSEQTKYGRTAWCVRDKGRDKGFVWERPLGKSDIAALAALGAAAPDGPILAAQVADVGVKEALISDDPDVYFTTPHFKGYPAVLLLLDRIPLEELAELIIEAWLARAPKSLTTPWLQSHHQP